MIGKTDDKAASAEHVRVAGLMSGTSCDGIDAALVDVSSDGIKLLAFECCSYTGDIRQALLALCSPDTCRIDDLCHLNFVLGELLAGAVVSLAERAQVELASIDLVGSHGHTVWHMPQGRPFMRRMLRSTLQIGEPCVIAQRTGITTIADFRPRDIAAGGQGAPLVPYVDYLLFRDEKRSRAILNLGGIANVTYIPAGAEAAEIVAFDTGPGNMVIDRLAEIVTDGRLDRDLDGEMARQGAVNRGLLDQFMKHEYFAMKPPKSTGREVFGWDYAKGFHEACLARELSAADILATATALTAWSIAESFGRLLDGPIDEVIISGGGVLNPALMAMLTERLAPAKVFSTAAIGLDPEAKEAMAFAILAVEAAHGRCNNAPAATGAGQATVMGKIVPGSRALELPQ